MTFAKFPKPDTNPEAAKRWAFLCGRGEAFTLANITRYSTVCSKHFAQGALPYVKVNPSLEPFNARWSQERLLKESQRKRRVAGAVEDESWGLSARPTMSADVPERQDKVQTDDASEEDMPEAEEAKYVITYSARRCKSARLMDVSILPVEIPVDRGTFLPYYLSDISGWPDTFYA